ncbi:MAG: DUF1178 family protein [Sulfitobacter sp.]
MIRYALKCQEGHEFESWFQSASAFDSLAKSGHLSCAVCGAAEVEKTLMTPRVGADKDRAVIVDPKVEALAKMRRDVEENATYVGGEFAEKAREMHEGTSPEGAIYGEASAAETRALIEDGVPVMPLPFKPKQKLQ